MYSLLIVLCIAGCAWAMGVYMTALKFPNRSHREREHDKRWLVISFTIMVTILVLGVNK